MRQTILTLMELRLLLGHSMSHSVGYNAKWAQPTKTKAAGRGKNERETVGFWVKWSWTKASLRSLKGRVSHSDAPVGRVWAEEPARGRS